MKPQAVSPPKKFSANNIYRRYPYQNVGRSHVGKVPHAKNMQEEATLKKPSAYPLHIS